MPFLDLDDYEELNEATLKLAIYKLNSIFASGHSNIVTQLRQLRFSLPLTKVQISTVDYGILLGMNKGHLAHVAGL
ncbi:hypothetical protein RB195_007096 [Necator americanus]|uniref:Uncharacterized protein n=1 Tax=Necator americanus TaxID=51031 RepID=A0ABR1BVL0_NECAM